MSNTPKFSEQSGKAYYHSPIKEFLLTDAEDILKTLISVERFVHSSNPLQNQSWEEEIESLQRLLSNSNLDGYIIFEYDIVRMGKRIDVILLIRHMVFSLEFKNGAERFNIEDENQAIDYATDLKNFHKESRDLHVCPILITKATEIPDNSLNVYDDKQIVLQYANSQTYIDRIDTISNWFGEDVAFDFIKWFNSEYCPTPTIVEAAIGLYKDCKVQEIAHSESGQEGIDRCEKAVHDIITFAKKNHKKCICFITGVPGAGKTLVGLDLAFHDSNDPSESITYLSGNGPLVEVLRAALRKSDKSDNTDQRRKTINSINGKIQMIYSFRKDCMQSPNPPKEHAVIFDEAQRCWDREHLSDWVSKRELGELNQSEAQFLIGTMDRHNDWSVIICLVGLGQDIYVGETGIGEWFDAAIDHYPHWDIFYSNRLFTQDDGLNREKIESHSNTHVVPELHLSTSVRSFRSDSVSSFIDCLLSLDPVSAKKVYESFSEKYPIFVTNNLDLAKQWVRKQARGSERYGIIASSSAQRLKPYGLFVPKDIDVANWFLASKYDLRSSYAFEVVASEFKVQGLEIDWPIVCWDADLRIKNDMWSFYKFTGTNWQSRNKESDQKHLINAYRVLLTRGRQGMVIFVPEGDKDNYDHTRKTEFYTHTFDYLKKCGIRELKEGNIGAM